MGGTVRFGRIAGISVGAHWSLLAIGGLLTVSLATGLLPASAPGAAGSYWLAATLGAAAFFGSILTHELAHAVVARRHGQRVEDITLWLLGGVARLGTEAPSARAELQVAVAGPLASLGLGAGFLAAAFALDGLGLGALGVVTLSWLGLINLVLAVFNLLPGAPLDGGRVLSALLWMHHGDRSRAHVSAARAGRVVGWGLVGLGVSGFLLGVGFGTLWTAFIGWFVVAASRAEEDAARARARLDHVPVGLVMSPPPPVVPEWITVADVPSHLSPLPSGRPPTSLLLARPEGDIGGVVTLDAIRRVPAWRGDAVRLRDIGIPREHLATAAPDDRALDVVLTARGPLPVVVLDQGRVVGVIDAPVVARILGPGEAARRAPVG